MQKGHSMLHRAQVVWKRVNQSTKYQKSGSNVQIGCKGIALCVQRDSITATLYTQITTATHESNIPVEWELWTKKPPSNCNVSQKWRSLPLFLLQNERPETACVLLPRLCHHRFCFNSVFLILQFKLDLVKYASYENIIFLLKCHSCGVWANAECSKEINLAPQTKKERRKKGPVYLSSSRCWFPK